MASQIDCIRIWVFADFQLTQALNRDKCKLILLRGCCGYGKSHFMREYLKLHETYLNQNGTYFASLNAALIENRSQFEMGLARITRHYRSDLSPNSDLTADHFTTYNNLKRLCIIFEDVASCPYQPFLLYAIKDLCENESLTLILLIDEAILLRALSGAEFYLLRKVLESLNGMGQHIDVNATPDYLHPSCLNKVIKDIINNTTPSPFFTTTYAHEKIAKLEQEGKRENIETSCRYFISGFIFGSFDNFFNIHLHESLDLDLRKITCAVKAVLTLVPYYLITHDKEEIKTALSLNNLLICVLFESLYAQPDSGLGCKYTERAYRPYRDLADAWKRYTEYLEQPDKAHGESRSSTNANTNRDTVRNLFTSYPETGITITPHPEAILSQLTESHDKCLYTFLNDSLQLVLNDFVKSYFPEAAKSVTDTFFSDPEICANLAAFFIICTELRTYFTRGVFNCGLCFELLDFSNQDFSLFAFPPINLTSVPRRMENAVKTQTASVATSPDRND